MKLLVLKLHTVHLQAREEVRLTHFYYSEWPGGVEEAEQVLLVIMNIPTRTSGDVGMLRNVKVDCVSCLSFYPQLLLHWSRVTVVTLLSWAE